MGTKRSIATQTDAGASVIPVKKAQVADIFDPIPTEVSIADGYYQKYYPTQATFNPCQFYIPASTDFISLSECYLELGIKLVTVAGAGLGTALDVGVVNNVAHSVIKRFDVKLNDTSTGEPTDLYHVKAYAQNLLNFTTEQKETYLANEGWYTDDATAAKMNTHTTATRLGTALATDNAGYNKGFLERTKLFYANFNTEATQESQEATFNIQPAVDIFQSGRLLIPKVAVDIQIDFNDPALVVMAGAGSTHKFQITKAVFWVRHVKVNPSVHLDVQQQQESKKRTARYPIRTTKPIRRTLQRGSQSFTFNDIFQQAVPDILTMGFVKSTNFNGAYDKSPFVFELETLTDVRWVVNGLERPMARLQIKSPDKVEAYETLFMSTGNHHRGFSPGIKRADYKDGFAVMRFNFTPDGKDAKNYTYKRNSGTLDLFLEFSAPLTENLTLVLLPEFENEILIYPNGVVTMDKNY